MRAGVSATVRDGLRRERRSPWTWGVALGLMCALIVAIYPSISDSLDELTRSYPESLKKAFGVTDFSDVKGYLNAEMFSLIVPLAAGYFALRSVARGLSGAEEQGELDVALSAPLDRWELVAGTFVAAITAVAGVLVVVLVLTLLGSVVFGAGLPLGAAVAGVAAVWPLAVFFAGVAVLAAGFLHHAAGVTGVSAGTLVAMYVLDLAGRLAEPAEPLREISAFKYYGSGLIEGIDPLAFAGLTLAGVILAAAGALVFERRDVLA